MLIIDAFTFYDAIDVLKMRLRLHAPYVDAFYICESDHSYAGKPKPYNLEARWDEFAEWHDKMRYIAFSPDLSNKDFTHLDSELDFKFSSPAWQLEFAQRNHLQTMLRPVLHDNDLVIVSDMDEFISPVTFQIMRASAHQDWEEARLFMTMHWFYMNCIQPGEIWKHPFVAKGSRYKSLHDVSLHRHLGPIPLHFLNAGWHFTCLGGFDVVLDKFYNTSHTEYITHGLNDPEYLRACFDLGIRITTPKKEPILENCEMGYLPISAFPLEIQKLMNDNPQFVRLNLGA